MDSKQNTSEKPRVSGNFSSDYFRVENLAIVEDFWVTTHSTIGLQGSIV